MVNPESAIERRVFPLETWRKEIEDAYIRIQPFVLRTPLEDMGCIAPQGIRLYFKMENLQETGSFKLRGATNKIVCLPHKQAQKGVIAASNGNHGMGVAAAAARIGIDAEVYVSNHVSPAKAKKIEKLGGRLRYAGSDPLAAELAARAAADASGKVFISPYNDCEVVAGQGTIAVELLEQVAQTDAVFIAVGGGGLISGIGAYLKAVSPQTKIVGCWPVNSPVMYECMRAGHILEVAEQPTVSESTAGGLEPGSVTLDMCRHVIDSSVLVTEEEILDAMRRVRDAKGWLIEGAAGVALAAFYKTAKRYAGKNVVVLICGGNLSPEVERRMKP